MTENFLLEVFSRFCTRCCKNCTGITSIAMVGESATVYGPSGVVFHASGMQMRQGPFNPFYSCTASYRKTSHCTVGKVKLPKAYMFGLKGKFIDARSPIHHQAPVECFACRRRYNVEIGAIRGCRWINDKWSNADGRERVG